MVHFFHKRPPFSSLEVRLIDGENSCSGRVEVLYDDYGWGTVSDDGWNLLGGDVICKQVACGSALSVTGGSFFKKGSGSIWMYDTNCAGTEPSLKSCISEINKNRKFTHKNDAGVVCRGKCERQTLGTTMIMSRLHVKCNVNSSELFSFQRSNW